MTFHLRLSTLLVVISLVKPLPALVFRNKFDELKLSPVYVDKTEFMRLLFDPKCTSSSEQFYFITLPHRFSKSTTLRMIQSFAEVELDEHGQTKPWHSTMAHRIFQGTKISQHPGLMENHLARYPVLYLDMTKYASTHQSHRKIASELNNKYLDALIPYRGRMSKIQTYIREGFPDNFTMSISSRKFIEVLYKRNMTIDALDSSLMLLVKFVYELFDNTPVILLIDEYDNTALRSYIFQRGYVARNYRKFNRILYKIIKAGKNFVKNMIITSVSSLAFASDDILNRHVTHMCFLNDHSFMEYFGITESDLEELFERYKCDAEERNLVREFYQPYRTAVKSAAIYHPYSINSYFTFRTVPDYHLALKTYWKRHEALGHNAVFYQSSIFRSIIQDLLNNGTYFMKLKKQHPGEALDQLELLRDTDFKDIKPQHINIFIRMYFELGYLSHVVSDMNSFVIANNDAREVVSFDLQVYHERFNKSLTTTEATTMAAPLDELNLHTPAANQYDLQNELATQSNEAFPSYESNY